MGKTKTLKVALIAAIASLLLALSVFMAAAPARAAEGAEPAPAENTFTLGAATASGNSIVMKMTPFVYVHASEGEDNDTFLSANNGKVVMTLPDGTTTATPSNLRFEGNAKGLKLYFGANFNPGTVASGTTLTLKAGLTVTGVAAADASGFSDELKKTYTLAADTTYTCAGGGVWLEPGEELPVIKQIAAADVKVSGVGSFGGSGNAITIDFGLTDVDGVISYIDNNAGGWDLAWVKQRWVDLNNSIVLSRNEQQVSYYRYLEGNGKIAFDYKQGGQDMPTDEYGKLLDGDVLTLKKGLRVYKIISATWYGYVNAESETKLVAELSEDVTFTYIEGAWYKPGEEPEPLPQIPAASVKVAGKATQWGVSGSAVIINFGLTDVDGEVVMVDKDSGGWAAHVCSEEKWTELKKSITVTRGTNNIEYGRFLVGEGKIAFDYGTATDSEYVNSLKKGDVLKLKQGLKISRVKAKHFSGYANAMSDFETVGVLSEDVTLIYDGAEWISPIWATSATIENEDIVKSLCVGQKIKMRVAPNAEALQPAPTFTSSDKSIATITKNGNITALKEGEVTLTVTYNENAKKSVTFTVKPTPAIDGLKIDLDGYAAKLTKDGTKYLRAYKGEPVSIATKESGENTVLDGIEGVFVYANGIDASGTVELTPEMLAKTGDGFTYADGKYTFNTTGEVTINVTATEPGGNTVSAALPVWVYDAPKTLEPISANRIINWSVALDFWFTDLIGGTETGYRTSLKINETNAKRYGVALDMVQLRVPELDNSGKTYTLTEVGEVSEKQYVVFFENFDAANVAKSAPVGTVLTLTEDFRFYRQIEKDWVAMYKFASPIKFVWTGTAWADYVADATDFTLTHSELTVPRYAVFSPEIKVEPSTAYLKPVCEVPEGQTVAEITADGKIYAKNAGSVDITVKAGSVVKTLKLTVADSEPAGLEVLNNRVFYVAEGDKLDISKVSVRVNYGKGSDGNNYYGEEIKLNNENAQFSTPATVGTHTVPVTVTVPLAEGNDYTGTVNVQIDVQENREVYVSNFNCNLDEGFFFGQSTLAVFFDTSFGNQANVYFKDLTEAQQKTLTEHIRFERAGTNAKIVTTGDGAPSFLQQILVVSVTLDGEGLVRYQEGDKLILERGLTFYRWFGDMDAQNVPVGEGDYVKVGELKYDVVFTFGSNGKFSWQVDPADGVVKEETVQVGLGKTHASNVAIVPEYATHGEWYYTVADPTIAKVNTQGLITGLKMGKTSVEAVLKTRDGETVKTVTFNVEVTDIADKLDITSASPVFVTPGSALDIESLINKYGIKGTVIMSSGAKGEEVDLTKARVTGYDSEKLGEQTLTFRLTVNGKSVSGTLKITVGEEKSGGKTGCGCKSGIAPAGMIFAGGGALLAVALLLARRGKKSFGKND